VYHRDIQTPRRELTIRRAAEYFWREIRAVWIADEALSRVFDMSSQLKQKLRSKRRRKTIKSLLRPGIQNSFKVVIF